MGHRLKVAFLSATLNPTWVPVVLEASRPLTFIPSPTPTGHNITPITKKPSQIQPKIFFFNFQSPIEHQDKAHDILVNRFQRAVDQYGPMG